MYIMNFQFTLLRPFTSPKRWCIDKTSVDIYEIQIQDDGLYWLTRIQNFDFQIVMFLCLYSVLCLLCLCARLFICALRSPAGKGLTSWLSFVVSN